RRLQGRLQAKPPLAVYLLDLRFRLDGLLAATCFDARHQERPDGRGAPASPGAEQLPCAAEADGVCTQDQEEHARQHPGVRRRAPQLNPELDLLTVDGSARDEEEQPAPDDASGPPWRKQGEKRQRLERGGNCDDDHGGAEQHLRDQARYRDEEDVCERGESTQRLSLPGGLGSWAEHTLRRDRDRYEQETDQTRACRYARSEERLIFRRNHPAPV